MAKLPDEIRIGTRRSKLAVTQAMEVKSRLLKAFPELGESQIEIIKIITSGDKAQNKNLAEIGGKGLFTKEIEEALFSGEIDIAVHSMKDMPDRLPDGLTIECVLEREDPRDAFISHKAATLADLPQGAVVGTSSTRRQAQLLRIRPDLKIVPFRGNVETRLQKLKNGDVDATLLAVAGLNRLDMSDKITSILDTETMLPAVAQGAIGVECRADNEDMLEILSAINHRKTYMEVRCERAFLLALNGNCTMPIAGLAEYRDDDIIHFRGLLAGPDGKEIHTTSCTSPISSAIESCSKAGEEIYAQQFGKTT